MIDGYLAKASARANKQGDGRHLVFGYRDGKREVEQVTVILVDHRVAEIHGDLPQVAAVTAEPETVTAGVLTLSAPPFGPPAIPCEPAATLLAAQ